MPEQNLLPLFRTPQKRANPKVAGIQDDKLDPHHKKLLKEFFIDINKPHPVKITISPKLASAILIGVNWRNPRKFNLSRAKFYSKDMLKGNWGASSDMICLSSDMKWLINGQHRLAGVELSGKSQQFFFALLPESAAGNIDRGASRNFAEVTFLDKEECSIIRTMIELVNDNMEKVSPYKLKEVHALYKPEVEFVASLKGLKRLHIKTAFKASFAWLLGQSVGTKHYNPIKEFITKMDSGIALSNTDVTPLVREWMLATKTGKHSEIISIFYKLANGVKCYLSNHKPKRVLESEKAVEWFRALNPEKLEGFKD